MVYRKPQRRKFFPRRPTSGYAFVSYSTKDWDVVRKLLEALKTNRVWVDKRNVELGDALPEKVEAGIAGAANFVLVLSKASLESRWVKYESHMATIGHLEDANFRILVLKIDDCQVPLRFRPFLYADLTKDTNALDSVARAAASKEHQQSSSDATSSTVPMSWAELNYTSQIRTNRLSVSMVFMESESEHWLKSLSVGFGNHLESRQ